MRIKKIRVSGFKSFCHPVNLQVKQNGITIIVGPNGCGKSNVVDAVRWVLGEQRVKHLRGSSMEDVIFSGTSNRPSKNISEVALFLDNQNKEGPVQYKDFDEVSVRRKIEKDKGSKYFINEKNR